MHNCREGSEGPYRERSLQKVLEALEIATVNQGTKEVSFFCFAESSEVLTEAGLKRIYNVRQDDYVLDFEGMSSIAASEKRMIQPTKTLRTKSGLEFTATFSHKIQVWSDKFPFHQFKMVKDIEVGDKLIGKLGGYEFVKGTKYGNSLSALDAELLGLICGDGYSVKGTIS